MRKDRGAQADTVTLEEFERRMRGGGNGGGGEEPNALRQWLRQKGREAVEAKIELLQTFNAQNARNFIESQPVLRRLGAEFDAIVNREGLEADIAAVKALWHHGLPKNKPSPA